MNEFMMNPWTQMGLGILSANKPGATFGQALGGVINELDPTIAGMLKDQGYFTGQYGKFYASYRNADWYQQRVKDSPGIAGHGADQEPQRRRWTRYRRESTWTFLPAPDREPCRDYKSAGR